MRAFSFKIVLYLSLLVSSLNAQNEQQRVQEGMNLLKEGSASQARRVFYQLKSQYPQNARYWYLSGLANLQMKDPSSALVDLNKSILLNPNQMDAYWFRHIANKETRNFQFALADISKYIELSPGDTAARFSRYSLAIYLKEFQEAADDGLWLIKKGLGGDTLIQTQIQLLEEANNYRSAIELLTLLINKKPDEDAWYFKRAQLYFSNAEHQKSLNDIERFLITNNRDLKALKLRFDNHFYLRNLPTCEKYIIEMIEMDPKNGTFLGDYGHILLQKGDWDKAETYFQKAINFKSESLGYVYLGRGIARFNKGDKSNACSDWERALILGEMVARNYLVKYCNR